MRTSSGFGSHLKRLLVSHNMKPQHIAEKLKVDSSLVRKWLAGQKVPSLRSEYYDLLCNYLDLSLSERIALKMAQIHSLEESNTRLQDLQKVEQLAAENEQALLSLLNAVTEPASLIDQCGTIIAANQAAARRLNTPLPELAGRCLYDFFPPELAEQRKKIISQVFTSGQPSLYKERTGDQYLMHSLYPAKDDSGQVTKVAIVATDLTEMENTLSALRESEERHRFLFQCSMDPILLTCPDGTILAANSAACDLLQMTEQEICAAGREGVLDTRDPNLELALAERKRNKQAQMHLTVIRKDGVKLLVHISSAIFLNSRGEEESYVILRPV